jgi:hypothetical protein
MSFSPDPRPASRYQAVTLDVFSQAIRAPEALPSTVRAHGGGTRVLRLMPAQVVRLVFRT